MPHNIYTLVLALPIIAKSTFGTMIGLSIATAAAGKAEVRAAVIPIPIIRIELDSAGNTPLGHVITEAGALKTRPGGNIAQKIKEKACNFVQGVIVYRSHTKKLAGISA